MDQDIHKLEDVGENAPPELRLIFAQLLTEFGTTCKIFRRVEDFGRWLSAGVANTSSPTAAIIDLRKGIRTRTTKLSQSEIQRIREHLASGAQENLVLRIP